MGNSGSSTKEIPAFNITSMSNKTNYYGISIQSFVNYKNKKRDFFDEEDEDENNYWIFIIVIIILLLFLLLILYLNKNI